MPSLLRKFIVFSPWKKMANDEGEDKAHRFSPSHLPLKTPTMERSKDHLQDALTDLKFTCKRL